MPVSSVEKYQLRGHYRNFELLYEDFYDKAVEHNREIGAFYSSNWGSSRIGCWVLCRFDNERTIKIRVVRFVTFPKDTGRPWFYDVYLCSIDWFSEDDLPLIWDMCNKIHGKYFVSGGFPYVYDDTEHYRRRMGNIIFVNGKQRGYIPRHKNHLLHKMNIHISSTRDSESRVREKIFKRIRRFLNKRLKGFDRIYKTKHVFGELKHYVKCLKQLHGFFKRHHSLLLSTIWKHYVLSFNNNKIEKTSMDYSSSRAKTDIDTEKRTKKTQKRKLRPIFDYPFYPS